MNDSELSLQLRYKGIVILNLKHRVVKFSTKYPVTRYLRYYVVRQGQSIFKAIFDKEIPKKFLTKALKIDEDKKGLKRSEWKNTLELTNKCKYK